MDHIDDSDDEWFYNSIQRYEEFLHYEFYGLVTSSTFIKDDRLIATCSRSINSKKNEILELRIADKLITKGDESIIRNRDFKVVSAGYLKNEATSVIANSDYIITSESCGVNIYSTENSDTDLISFMKSLRKEIVSPLITKYENDSILSGTNLYNIHCHTIADDQSLPFTIRDKELIQHSELSFLNCVLNNIYFGFKQGPLLTCVDSRNNSISFKVDLNSSVRDEWFYSVSQLSNYIAFGNSLGDLTVFDSRNLTKEYLKIVLESNKLDPCKVSNVKINFDPNNTFISISGFDSSVFIYSLKSENKSPLFIHDGHKKKADYLTGHLWHPTKQNLIFSTDNIGMLQVWQFI